MSILNVALWQHKRPYSKSNSSGGGPHRPWTWPVLPQLELHEVVHCRLRSSPPRSSPGTMRRSRVVPGLGCGGLELKLHKEEDKYIEAQPRCTCFPLSATSLQCWWGGRQVQRGAAELYLSSYRINNAEESAVDYRVQLQRNVDEEGGKYTEAQPRCTWPLSESTLRQGRWGLPPLLSDFRLVHWRNSWFFSRNLFVPADCHPHPYLALKRWT